MPFAADIEAAMGTGTDAGVFVPAPVDEVVPALGTRPRMIGDLVGGQPACGAHLLREVIERARSIAVRNRELAGGMQCRERRLGLNGQLIEREMLGGFRD